MSPKINHFNDQGRYHNKQGLFKKEKDFSVNQSKHEIQEETPMFFSGSTSIHVRRFQISRKLHIWGGFCGFQCIGWSILTSTDLNTPLHVRGSQPKELHTLLT